MKLSLTGLLATASAKNPNHDCIVQCQKDFFRAAFKCETLEGTYRSKKLDSNFNS